VPIFGSNVVSCITRPGNDDICRPMLNYTKCGLLAICKIVVSIATESVDIGNNQTINSGSEEYDGTGVIVGGAIGGVMGAFSKCLVFLTGK
jgi:hypothetical protein